MHGVSVFLMHVCRLTKKTVGRPQGRGGRNRTHELKPYETREGVGLAVALTMEFLCYVVTYTAGLVVTAC